MNSYPIIDDISNRFILRCMRISFDSTLQGYVIYSNEPPLVCVYLGCLVKRNKSPLKLYCWKILRRKTRYNENVLIFY